MGLTTIKVETELRDRISSAARARALTIGEYLDQVISEARRRERLQAMAEAMRANPPDPAYWAEVAEFDTLEVEPRD